MARQCSICTHDQQQGIEAALLDGLAETKIAARYGVSASALGRHRRNHLAPALWRALERREELTADRLVARLDGLAMRLASYESRAATDRDWGAARGLADSLMRAVELIAKLRGDLGDGAARVTIDARRQTLALGQLDESKLRALADAADEGRLEEVAERAGLPPGVAAVLAPAPVVEPVEG